MMPRQAGIANKEQTMKVRLDRVTRAVFLTFHRNPADAITRHYAREHADHDEDETWTCRDQSLYRLDEIMAPSLVRVGGDLVATAASARLTGDVTIYGADVRGRGADRAATDPLVMIHHVQLGETIASAAAGLRLDQVLDVACHPTLAALADATVLRIVDGDARPSGGHCFVHVHVEPEWEEIEVEPRGG